MPKLLKRKFDLQEIILEIPATLRLSAPMVAGLIGQMLLSWADNLMIGPLGVTPLAACAFANNVLIVFLVFGYGVMSSVSVLASQAFGGGRKEEVGEVLLAGGLLALLCGLLLSFVAIALLPIYQFLGQPVEVVNKSKTYLIFVAASIVPTLIFTSAKSFAESVLRPWLPFWVTLTSVLLNVFLNWVFIYGNLGVIPLELTGAGLATFLSRLASMILLILIIFAVPHFRAFLLSLKSFPSKELFLRIFKHIPTLFRIGLPSGLQVIAEVGAFSFAGLMMGWLGSVSLAAHQIALTCAGTSFMIPLGVSHALTVRIGQIFGSRQNHKLLPVAASGLFFSLFVMSLSAVIFFVFARQISSWFLQTYEVVNLASNLLVIVGIFQLFDGTQ
ncbi:MAG: MATE family efflux transporter, partial [Chthoniobacterales bacterium]|nr:MATE family efflux transporter [Chthoniobacterales bacterium]